MPHPSRDVRTSKDRPRDLLSVHLTTALSSLASDAMRAAARDPSGTPCGPLRSCVPGTAGNKREQPTTNPRLFATFAYVRGSLAGSEPATFHRGERYRLAFPCGFRGLCGLFAVPMPASMRAPSIDGCSGAVARSSTHYKRRLRGLTVLVSEREAFKHGGGATATTRQAAGACTSGAGSS
jgi:hypothetical protein